MGIESPATYGDYYWAKQVEAQQFFDEGLEQAYAPFFSRFLSTLTLPDDIPEGLRNFIGVLAEPPSAGFGGFALGVGVEMIDETLHSLMSPMMKIMSRSINRGALETWLTGTEGNTLFRRGKIQEDFWKLITTSEGYDEFNAKFLYQAQAPYPTIQDILLWSRYHGSPDNTWTTAIDKMDIDASDYPLWEWLGLQRLTTEQVQSLYKRGLFSDSDLYTELAQIGWGKDDRPILKDLAYMLPNAMLQVQGDLMSRVSTDQILRDISASDIHPDYAQKYLDAVLTKPASQDLIAYHLRQDPNLSGLDADLKRIGIHPEYTNIYKTLAYQIPPVADIITMAVREAFTPAVAARFGQYEDFPPDFGKYAGMKGLSQEWAERYWAAHWSLPSPQQGFAMLHRGVITDSELDILLRALDVMPFWREKLKQIAYRPLTRVDVRRMYKEGVLSEREVFESYLKQGYNEENSERMAEFTVRQTLSSLAKFTSGDIVKAYAQRMIDRAFAIALLKEIGIRSEDAGYIIDTAEYKRQWDFTEEKIKGIKNLYKRQEYDENKTKSELDKLNLPSDQVNVLMEQWWFEVKAEARATWTTAQTLKFAKEGLITRDRAIQELRLNNYDQEHINIYMATI